MVAGLLLIIASIALTGLPASGQAPVHVWLGSGGAVAPRERVRVYVQTTSDGYVVVLHRRPDGTVQVLFPDDPATDAFTPAGTYEIRGSDDAAALVVPDQGSGLVLAAVSPDPFRFAEFVAGGAWNSAILSAASLGADAEGALTDIVQRMLGDGSFNYDLVAYTVAAPQAYSLEDTVGAPTATAAPPVCVGCSYVDITLLPDLLFAGRRHRGNFPQIEAPPTPPGPTLALYHSGRATVAARAQARVRAPTLVTIARPRAPMRAAGSTRPTLPPIVMVQTRPRSPSNEVAPTRALAVGVRAVPVTARPSASSPPSGRAVIVSAARPPVAPRAPVVAPVPAASRSPSPPPARDRATIATVHTAGWRH